jgi:glycosyltransferase involved in cell wall biosynthesis
MDRPAVFFWQNMPAHHQTGALDAFAKIWGAPVTGIWAEDISSNRCGDGWQASRRLHLRDVFLPSAGWRHKVDDLASNNLGAIHVFSGIGAYPSVTRAARIILRQPRPKVALIVETALKSPWRRLPSALKSIYHYYPVRAKIGAVMAIGSLAENFYESIGFKESQVYPYLYQCDAPQIIAASTSHDELRIAFVGRLAAYKGLDLLFEALAPLGDRAWSLGVYGDGPAKAHLLARVKRLGLASRIHFHGLIASDAVVPTLATHDLCIVPSRYDGWGMATSEALQAGIPVLVSDAAGSRDIIRVSGAGDVFPSGKIHVLTALLAQRIDSPDIILEEKRRARAYAPKISSNAVGEYLAESFEHAFLGRGLRPQAEWLIRK